MSGGVKNLTKWMALSIALVMTATSAGCIKGCGQDTETEPVVEKKTESKPPADSHKIKIDSASFTGEIVVPDELLMCGNDPTYHGAVPVPGRKGLYDCPPDLPNEPICAYYVESPSRDITEARVNQYRNPCQLCVFYFKKDETWESGSRTYTLIGYAEGNCDQGVFKPQ